MRIVWTLRTPNIEMDMIAYRNCFDMDTLIGGATGDDEQQFVLSMPDSELLD